MVQESTRYDGEDVALYRIDDDATLVQQRFDGVHAAPVEHDGDTYLVVNLTDYDEPMTDVDPFGEVQDTLTGYDAVDDDAVEQLGGDVIGTDTLPEDTYNTVCDMVAERGFAVESLADPYQEPVAEDEYSEEEPDAVVHPA